MNAKHHLTYRVIAKMLLVGLFLQSCGTYLNAPLLQLEGNSKQTKHCSTDLIAIHQLDNQELTAEGGYLVTFHAKEGKLQADVSVERNQKVPNYKNLPIIIEQGTNLVRLSRLAPKVQQSYIKFQPSKTSQLNRICIFNGGIAGGMMEGDVEQKKEPQNEVVKTFSAEEFATWQRLNFNTYLPYIPEEEIKYQLLHHKIIGSGGYGSVYKGKYQGRKVAIKVLNKQGLYKDSIAVFKKEATIMANTPHNNIILIKGVCPAINAIVMEYMRGGTLEDLILECGKDLSLQQRYQIALDIAEGLCYLHDRGIVHCDLKSANILLDEDFRAKVADFGISGLKSEHTTFGAWEGSTYPWVAPEIFHTKKNSREGDVYSYGMILWQLWACKRPFEDVECSEIMDYIKAGNREVISEDTPSQIRKVIKQCWLPEPPLKKDTDTQQRLTMKGVRRLLEVGLEEGDKEGFASNKEKELMNEIERLKQQLEQEKQKVRETGKEKEKEKGSESFLGMESILRTNTAFGSISTLVTSNWNQAVYPMSTRTSNKTSENMKRRKEKINLFKSNISILGTDNEVGNKEIGLKHQAELEDIIKDWPEGEKILTQLQNSDDTLGLRYCRLTAEEIDILIIHPRFYQIHTLNLRENKIGDSGAIKLSEALPHIQIHTLNLIENEIGDSGASKLSDALPNTQLHTLYLSLNQIGTEGATKLAEALPKSQVHTLNLAGNQIGASGAIKLTEALPNTQIHTLDLGGNEIGDSGASKLAEALPHTQIHTLKLWSNQIGTEGASKIAEALPHTQIHTLNLEYNKGDSVAIKLAEALPHTQIHTLTLAFNEIGDSGVIKLAGALPKSQIHTLNLGYNKIGDSEAIKLSEALPHTQIHTLNLKYNKIGDSGAIKLSEALPNTQIHTLDLGNNEIGDLGVNNLAEVLPNTKIHTLHLRSNQIGYEGAIKLAGALPNTKIHTLDLGYNQIGREIQGILKLKNPKIKFTF